MLHEDRNNLTNETLDKKRAIDSLREELEAIDWYNQRADACKDTHLKAILEHNANEEKEHAAMLIEWLRQHDDHFDHELKQYFDADTPDIAGLEEK